VKDHSAWNLPNTIWPEESLECEQRYVFDLFFGGSNAYLWEAALGEKLFYSIFKVQSQDFFILKRIGTNMLLSNGL
jgi:hypothetical protein